MFNQIMIIDIIEIEIEAKSVEKIQSTFNESSILFWAYLRWRGEKRSYCGYIGELWTYVIHI